MCTALYIYFLFDIFLLDGLLMGVEYLCGFGEFYMNKKLLLSSVLLLSVSGLVSAEHSVIFERLRKTPLAVMGDLHSKHSCMQYLYNIASDALELSGDDEWQYLPALYAAEDEILNKALQEGDGWRKAAYDEIVRRIQQFESKSEHQEVHSAAALQSLRKQAEEIYNQKLSELLQVADATPEQTNIVRSFWDDEVQKHLSLWGEMSQEMRSCAIENFVDSLLSVLINKTHFIAIHLPEHYKQICSQLIVKLKKTIALERDYQVAAEKERSKALRLAEMDRAIAESRAVEAKEQKSHVEFFNADGFSAEDKARAHDFQQGVEQDGKRMAFTLEHAAYCYGIDDKGNVWVHAKSGDNLYVYPCAKKCSYDQANQLIDFRTMIQEGLTASRRWKLPVTSQELSYWYKERGWHHKNGDFESVLRRPDSNCISSDVVYGYIKKSSVMVEWRKSDYKSSNARSNIAYQYHGNPMVHGAGHITNLSFEYPVTLLKGGLVVHVPALEEDLVVQGITYTSESFRRDNSTHKKIKMYAAHKEIEPKTVEVCISPNGKWVLVTCVVTQNQKNMRYCEVHDLRQEATAVQMARLEKRRQFVCGLAAARRETIKNVVPPLTLSLGGYAAPAAVAAPAQAPTALDGSHFAEKDECVIL